MTTFLLFIVGVLPAFAIAASTGNLVLSFLISLIIWIAVFTVSNMGGGHFNEAIGFALGLSMFQAIPNFIASVIGKALHGDENVESKIDKSDDPLQQIVNSDYE